MRKTEWTMETLDNLSAFKRDIASNTTIKHKNTITEEVLDKIRAEIEKARAFQRAMDEYEIATGLRIALEIIDKYKADSEVEE